MEEKLGSSPIFLELSDNFRTFAPNIEKQASVR